MEGGHGRGRGGTTTGRGRGRGPSTGGGEDARALNAELLAAPSAAAVRELVRARVHLFNLVNCATAAHRIAVLTSGASSGAPEQPQQQQQQQRSPGAPSARRDALVAGAPPDPLPAELCVRAAELVERDPSGAPARNLANLIWALAKLSDASSKPEARAREAASRSPAPYAAASARLHAAVLGAARGRLGAEFKSQELANLAWALARLPPAVSEAEAEEGGGAELERGLLRELCLALAGCLGASTAQGIANSAWAVATLHASGRLRDKPSGEGLRGQSTPHTTALAAFDVPAVARAAAQRICEFKPQELASTAWALGKLAGAAAEAEATEGAAAAGDGGGGGAEEARAGQRRAEASAFGSLADAMLLQLGGSHAGASGGGGLQWFSSQQAANAVWGCARLTLAARGSVAPEEAQGRGLPPALPPALPRSERLRRVALACAPRLSEFRGVELSQLAWAAVTASAGVAYNGSATSLACAEEGEEAGEGRPVGASDGSASAFSAALAAAARAAAKQRALTAPCASQLLWALARLGSGGGPGAGPGPAPAAELGPGPGPADTDPAAAVRALCRALRRGSAALAPLDVANAWWALGRLGVAPPARAGRALRRATRRLLRRSAALAVAAAADAAGSHAAGGGGGGGGRGQQQRAGAAAALPPPGRGGGGGGGMSTQHIATVAWAAARLGAPAADQRLCRALARATVACAPHFNPRDLANAMCAFEALKSSGVDVERPGLVEALASSATAQLGAFNAQELLKFAGAHARAGGRNEVLTFEMSAQRTLAFDFAARPGAAGPGPRAGSALQPFGQGQPQQPQPLQGGGRPRLSVLLQSRAPGRHLRQTGTAAWEASVALAHWLWAQRSPVASQALAPLLEDAPERGGGGGGGIAGSSAPRPGLAAAGCSAAGPGAPAQRSALKDLKWAGSTAVELGAGLGLPSIVAAHLGCRTVVATDGDAATLALLRANCAANAPGAHGGEGGGGEGGRCELRVAELSWGCADAMAACELSRPPELLLAADVVYGADEAVWRSLLDSMLQLAGPGTLLLQAQVQRYGREAADGCEPRFRALLARHFESVQLPPDELEACAPAELVRTNCTLHALRRRLPGPHAAVVGAAEAEADRSRRARDDRAPKKARRDVK